MPPLRSPANQQPGRVLSTISQSLSTGHFDL